MNAKQETTAFFDAVFSVCSGIDFAVALPSTRKSALWLHPDHSAGAFLAGCDRDRAEGLRGLLYGKNQNGGSIFWRPAVGGPLVLLDDLSEDDVAGVAAKYSALTILTSPGKCQAWIRCDRNLTFDERHIIQSALVGILNSDGTRRADPGATSGRQVGRVPGFYNRKPKYLPNFPLVSLVTVFDSGKLELDANRFCPSPATPARALEPAAGVSSPALKGGAPQARSPSVISPPVSSVSSSFSPSGRDESRAEFAFACAQYQKHLDIEAGIQSLTQRALDRGKCKNFAAAEKYARKTFDVAALRHTSVITNR